MTQRDYHVECPARGGRRGNTWQYNNIHVIMSLVRDQRSHGPMPALPVNCQCHLYCIPHLPPLPLLLLIQPHSPRLFVLRWVKICFVFFPFLFWFIFNSIKHVHFYCFLQWRYNKNMQSSLLNFICHHLKAFVCLLCQ